MIKHLKSNEKEQSIKALKLEQKICLFVAESTPNLKVIDSLIHIITEAVDSTTLVRKYSMTQQSTKDTETVANKHMK